jgi:hypothetical protein
LVDGHGTIWPVEEPIPPGYHTYLGTLSQRIDLGNKEKYPPIRFCSGIGAKDMRGATSTTLIVPNGLSVLEGGLYGYDLTTGVQINHPLLTTEARNAFREIRLYRIPEIVQRLPIFEAYLGKEVHIALDRRNEHVNPADYVNLVAEMLVEFARFVDVVSSGHAIDILVKGVNKGSGILEMCKITSISSDEILFIGDSDNDLSGMEITRWAGCPSNASKRCKDLVHSLEERGWASEFPYVQGVIDVMDRYIPKPMN